MRRWRITYREYAGAPAGFNAFVTAASHHQALQKFKDHHPDALITHVMCVSE